MTLGQKQNAEITRENQDSVSLDELIKADSSKRFDLLRKDKEFPDPDLENDCRQRLRILQYSKFGRHDISFLNSEIESINYDFQGEYFKKIEDQESSDIKKNSQKEEESLAEEVEKNFLSREEFIKLFDDVKFYEFFVRSVRDGDPNFKVLPKKYYIGRVIESLINQESLGGSILSEVHQILINQTRDGFNQNVEDFIKNHNIKARENNKILKEKYGLKQNCIKEIR
jgi:hypothetical protein